jgi:Zn-dependent protease
VSVDTILDVIYLAAGLLVGLVGHEYAHALVALRLGDHTPRQAGRLTLDPRPHVDPFGTLLLPAILLLPVLFGRAVFLIFAYAKPQPLNPWNLRKPENNAVAIALAGPAANVILAFGLGGLLRAGVSGELGRFLADALIVNVTLAAMNLVPLPPLDGARVVARFLSGRAREVYTNLDQYGALFILVIFFIFNGPIFAFVKAIGNGICQITAGGQCFI